MADLSQCYGEIETAIDQRRVNMSEAAGTNQEDLRKKLIQRSVEDEDLRQKLLSDQELETVAGGWAIHSSDCTSGGPTCQPPPECI